MWTASAEFHGPASFSGLMAASSDPAEDSLCLLSNHKGACIHFSQGHKAQVPHSFCAVPRVTEVGRGLGKEVGPGHHLTLTGVGIKSVFQGARNMGITINAGETERLEQKKKPIGCLLGAWENFHSGCPAS